MSNFFDTIKIEKEIAKKDFLAFLQKIKMAFVVLRCKFFMS